MEKGKILSFRLLKAEEIDCRIATVSANGVSLLLYKDARVDQNLLDETVGPMNWQRSHSRENANCIVSIWDEEKTQWVSKEDTGTESYSEKEKGKASDSFKRACFNWGIGRELYTAPFIWVSKNGCTLKELDDKGKKKYTCYDRFSVKVIGYDEERKIKELVIVNESKQGIIAYRFGKAGGSAASAEEPVQPKIQDTIQDKQVQALYNECKRTGVGWRQVCINYQVEKFSDLTWEQYHDAVKRFSALPDKPEPGEEPSELDHLEDSGLPWNTTRR